MGKRGSWKAAKPFTNDQSVCGERRVRWWCRIWPHGSGCIITGSGSGRRRERRTAGRRAHKRHARCVIRCKGTGLRIGRGCAAEAQGGRRGLSGLMRWQVSEKRGQSAAGTGKRRAGGVVCVSGATKRVGARAAQTSHT